MNIKQEVLNSIGQPESESLEYKAVLPPAVTMAQLIASFANSSGGAIVLGVLEDGANVEINGISDEFRAVQITRKAIDLLSPAPVVVYDYVIHEEKRLFVIEVAKSVSIISLGGRIYRRNGAGTTVSQGVLGRSIKNADIGRLLKRISDSRKSCTAARAKLLDHYESMLSILDDLGRLLYPDGSNVPTRNAEGKILIRILFASCADTFETFMSDLLYEIYLAKPEALKSDAPVTVKEVLDCTDLQEFIGRYAKEKLKKLQRGSVKGFIEDNQVIRALKVFDPIRQSEIEKILEIRHLFTHQNGIIDEKFRRLFPGSKVNDEFRITLDEFLKRFEYLAESIEALDQAALKVFKLACYS